MDFKSIFKVENERSNARFQEGISNVIHKNCNTTPAKANEEPQLDTTTRVTFSIGNRDYEGIKAWKLKERTGFSLKLIKRLVIEGELLSYKLGSATYYLVPELECKKCNPVEQFDIKTAARFAYAPQDDGSSDE